ncbi:MAG: RIP metalloprotease RseP [SAR86 cluster bacterium]|nr:RIP metalloprotease RseP [SAR86 cluster bacterium]
MSTLIYISSFLVLIGILVTIHEYGHFIVARLCKVHVQTFSLGMGPIIYKRKDKHGTEFALSALPLGGYVSMITNKLIEVEPEIKEQLTKEQLKNTFDSKPKWQRAAIMIAGPLANFILSILVFCFIFMNTIDPNNVAVIKNVDKSAYIQPVSNIAVDDQLLGINSQVITDPKDFSLELLSYAGLTGKIDLLLKNNDSSETYVESIYVEDFLDTSEAQKDPMSGLGLAIEYRSLPIIGGVSQGSAADLAGINIGDQIVEIGGQSINYIQDIKGLIKENPGKELGFVIKRNGEEIYKSILIDSNLNQEDVTQGSLGVNFGSQRGFISSLNKAVYETYNLSIKTLLFIGKMLTGNMGADNLSGPIGIAQMAGDTAKAGVIPFLYLMALLSISLGVLNLLPLPVLDGGQLVLLGVEAVRGKPLPEKVENYVFTIGAVLVGMLMIFAVFNDISRYL